MTIKSEPDGEAFRLCYIDEHKAWFTTAEPGEQRGDDWNEAPYEHNAGDPYEFRYDAKKPNVKPYHLYTVYYDGPWQTPGEMAWSGNSHFSVEMINDGCVAWLIPEHRTYNLRPIPAWTTLNRFKELIALGGGKTYLPD